MGGKGNTAAFGLGSSRRCRAGPLLPDCCQFAFHVGDLELDRQTVSRVTCPFPLSIARALWLTTVL